MSPRRACLESVALPLDVTSPHATDGIEAPPSQIPKPKTARGRTAPAPPRPTRGAQPRISRERQVPRRTRPIGSRAPPRSLEKMTVSRSTTLWRRPLFRPSFESRHRREEFGLARDSVAAGSRTARRERSRRLSAYAPRGLAAGLGGGATTCPLAQSSMW